MKHTLILFGLLSTFAFSAVAQGVEYDDMYFNAADRAKLREARQTAFARNDRTDRGDKNPTDSYSARNVNPEYTARSKSKTARTDEDYYISNYERAYQYNQWNHGYTNWYNNRWYRNNYWSPSIYSWNSPYYGSYYDAWGNPWVNPYFRTGWSTSFSFYSGSAWRYGYGGMGYYDPFYNPYYDPYFGHNSWWSPYGASYGYWGGGYWGGYPRRVIVVDNTDYRANYGKRNSRSTQLNRDARAGSNRSGGVDNGRMGSNGRQMDNMNAPVRSRSDRYVAPARSNNSTVAPSRSNSNNSNWSAPRRSDTSSPSYRPSTPSRTSSPSFNNTGGGSRSSGGTSGGSSGGGGSRSTRGGN